MESILYDVVISRIHELHYNIYRKKRFLNVVEDVTKVNMSLQFSTKFVFTFSSVQSSSMSIRLFLKVPLMEKHIKMFGTTFFGTNVRWVQLNNI